VAQFDESVSRAVEEYFFDLILVNTMFYRELFRDLSEPYEVINEHST